MFHSTMPEYSPDFYIRLLNANGCKAISNCVYRHKAAESFRVAAVLPRVAATVSVAPQTVHRARPRTDGTPYHKDKGCRKRSKYQHTSSDTSMSYVISYSMEGISKAAPV